MAITKKIGGVRLDDHTMQTSLDVGTLMDLVIPGMAFEQDALSTASYNHLEDRLKALLPARKLIQRQFFNPGIKYQLQRNENGEKEKVAVPSWSPSAKLRNATGDLRRWIEDCYIDAWEINAAAMPPFMLYLPEQLPAEKLEFDVGQAGEFMMYDFTGAGKAMIADGESRHHAIDLVLTGKGARAVSGARREKLKAKIVPVVVFHGIDPTAMGQVFADLNGKGVVLSKVETVSRDTRDPWVKATWDIFSHLGVDLETRGRQISAASRLAGRHLMLNQAIMMVRALGLGSVGAATSSSAMTAGVDFDRVVKAGRTWFGEVLKYFGDGPAVMSDPTKVLRAVPVKVSLGVMGHAFYKHDLAAQHQHRASLSDINWNIDDRWNGIAGKVSKDKNGEFTLAASGAKEIGGRAKTALCSPDSNPGKEIRGRQTSAAA